MLVNFFKVLVINEKKKVEKQVNISIKCIIKDNVQNQIEIRFNSFEKLHYFNLF